MDILLIFTPWPWGDIIYLWMLYSFESKSLVKFNMYSIQKIPTFFFYTKSVIDSKLILLIKPNLLKSCLFYSAIWI